MFAFLASVIGARFFPSADPLSGLLQTFGVFAVGYLMRPIGGMLFGHLGDRLGAQAGAPALDGRDGRSHRADRDAPHARRGGGPCGPPAGRAAAGSGIVDRRRLAGSICYLVEAAPPGRRDFFSSLTILGAAAGLLLASVVVEHVGRADHRQVHAWGWRLPFLGGIVIGAVGWWMRRGLVESPAFQQVVEAHGIAHNPVGTVIREHWPRLLEVCGMGILVAVGFYTLFAWMPTYLTHILRPRVAHPDLINTAAIAV